MTCNEYISAVNGKYVTAVSIITYEVAMFRMELLTVRVK
jgi:hypothetical protein